MFQLFRKRNETRDLRLPPELSKKDREKVEEVIRQARKDDGILNSVPLDPSVLARLTAGMWPIDSPGEAIKVMRRELSRYDREVLCVVNLNTRKQPINFHVVSVGELNQSIASIPNILKSGILSNAGSFLLSPQSPVR